MSEPESLLANLDPEQRLVATSLTAPTVVIAGAGTGKTRAITHRIAYACAIARYDPRAVLAVTFTTRAAGEMRSRLQDLGVGSVQARTFHSAALRQCQYFWPRAYRAEFPRIVNNKMALVAEAAGRVKVPVDTAALRDLVGEISWSKVSNITMDSYVELSRLAKREVATLEPTAVARVFATYEELKRDRGLVDFDDILLCNAALLSEHPQIADEVRRQYRHFVVDEYQDVSPLQETLLHLWRGESRDLCVVGDPAQTIHSFAGAQSRFLTTFQQRFPAVTTLTLVRNYRSTPQIVSLANKVIATRNEGVKLVAQRASGVEPVFDCCANEPDEAAAVAQWLKECADRGIEYRQMAVLFRINAQSPLLEAALTAQGIPYLVRGAEKFYDRAEVKQALLSLRAAARLIPETASDNSNIVDGVSQVKHILETMGWSQEAPVAAGAVRERWESLSALVAVAEDVAADRKQIDQQVATLGDVVEELDALAAAQCVPTAQGVTLATLHSAKGLEWDAVAIFGAHEGTIPFALATSPADLAEEQRLLYVGVTRARSYLRLSWSQGRHGDSGTRSVSRFLEQVVPASSARKQVKAATATSRRRGTVLAQMCRICQGRLTDSAERKIGRHLECEANYDEQVLERLREWRRQEASAAKIPAYCIFTDATIIAIAEAMPTNERELLRIPGVGASKLSRYGDSILELLREE
ncbi:MAG: ATP-dependent DNA helicase UvrD2 [Propionibacteriaceae bacterium]